MRTACCVNGAELNIVIDNSKGVEGGSPRF